jgi:prevent-host-death family protein
MRKSRKAVVAAAYPLAAGGAVVSVREAKAHFSALVAKAAEGEEITITWHGQPRARLSAVRSDSLPFRVDRAWLRSMKVRPGGPSAKALIREDRDARG